MEIVWNSNIADILYIANILDISNIIADIANIISHNANIANIINVIENIVEVIADTVPEFANNIADIANTVVNKKIKNRGNIRYKIMALLQNYGCWSYIIYKTRCHGFLKIL